jgi:NADPH2:quinone reductase
VPALPTRMDFVDAVALGLAAQTAWFALLERGGFEAGDVVLVTGASGAVGQAAVQIASAWAAVVMAAASNVERAKPCWKEATAAFVDLSAADLRNSLREQVHAATGGQGIDIVIDTLGGDAFDAVLRAMAWCGRIVSVGFAAGRIPEIKAGHLLVKNIARCGLQWTDYRDRQPQRVARAHAALTAVGARRAAAAHHADPAAARFAQALRLIEERRATGRLILTME